MALIEQKLTGVKKRQQIENASRVMFIWVAIASVAVSICIVTAQSFFQKIAYNNKVISIKQTAADTLGQNIANAAKLKEAVDSLVGDQNLASVKLNPGDPNTKSVLDALPSVPDTTEIATSLQQAILSRSGVVIESITVQNTAGTSTIATTGTPSPSGPVEEPFSVVVDGPYDKIHTMLLDIERTIRPIKLTEIDLAGQDSAMRATINGVTYYQPAQQATIQEETVR